MKDNAKSILGYAGSAALAAGAIGLAPMTGGASLYALPLATTLAQNTANRAAMREQNAYNSPERQMQRYREAGLNPNLIYGQGTPGNQSAPVDLGVPELDPLGPEGSRAKYSIQRDLAQINKYNVEAAWQNANLKEEQRHYVATKQVGELTRNALLETELPFARGNALEKYRGNKAKAEVLLSEVNLKAAQLENFKMDNRIKAEVLRDKQYANWMHQFGIEKGDNIFMRGGVRGIYYMAPQLREAWKKNNNK